MSTAPPAPESLVGVEYELDAGAVAHGGFCVARHEGRVVFVRHTLPGERVRVRVTEGTTASRFLRADAVAVLTASPDRVEPPCPWAGPGRCGGCDWQHVRLGRQRGLKAEVVREQLSRLAGLDLPVTVEAVDGDSDGLGWRTRVRFAVDEQARLALRKHRSHDTVAIDYCRIAAPGVVAVEVSPGRWPGADAVEVVASAHGDRSVLVHPRAGARLRLPRVPEAGSLLVAGAARPVRGRAWVREDIGGTPWRVAAGTFWQVHPGAAGALVAAVLEGVAAAPGETAVDLYAGAGLFAHALGAVVGEQGVVVAVEGDARAAADARRNLHASPHVRIETGRVELVLRTPGRLGLESADAVVLDPPREGAGPAVVAAVAALRPRVVAYVACDPAPLARDLAHFAAAGYAVRSLRAFDIFPMTQHVECVAVLERRAEL